MPRKAYKRLTRRAIPALFLAMTCAAGCAHSHHRIPDGPPSSPAAFFQQAAAQTGVPEKLVEYRPYHLANGDVLEIAFQLRHEITDEPYRLKIGDRIRIVFPYQAQFNQDVTVSGDGQVRCLLVGGLRAAGYTAGDLELQLKERYRSQLKEPELTVMVDSANVQVEELKKAITSAPRGQLRRVPIKPDGTIDLPYIGECFVAGRTVNEAKAMLDQRYVEADLPEVEVAVQTVEFAPKNIFIAGEVLSPGTITTQMPMTLVQALFQQGGPNSRADIRKIMLVRKKQEPVPQAILFDLQAMLEVGRAGAAAGEGINSEALRDVYLADGDIIFVPPTDLARANDWIDQVFTQGIRAVFPYSGNVGMNFGYQIHNAGYSVRNRRVGPPGVVATFGP